MQSPASSPRSPLANRTNFFSPNPWTHAKKAPGSPSKKRSLAGIPSSPNKPSKRVKRSNDEDSDAEIEKEVFDLETRARHEVIRARQRTMVGMLNGAASGRPSFRAEYLPTRGILQSLVSSQKSDTFKIPSINSNEFWTPPYSCAYSNAAKQGGQALLAVATEQGPIYIFNTSKRQEWDPEPQRTTLQPHHNGVFDVAWNNDSTRLATASGDHTGQITDVETQQTLVKLRGHKSTVKTISWAHGHDQLLSTGGRDGCIALWDLRVNSAWNEEERDVLGPVVRIENAHDLDAASSKKKITPQFKSITSLIYPENDPHALISAGSYDGTLRLWDIRNTQYKKKPAPVLSTPLDPTTAKSPFNRPRGIVSLTLGSGPTAGLIFGLAADARIHTYSVTGLSAINNGTSAYTNPQSGQPCTYYVRIRMSPCGRWLASGSARDGKAYAWDVTNAGSLRHPISAPVVLSAQKGEVGPVDWAEGSLATCADDGTVSIWRPDAKVAGECRSQPEEKRWNYSWAKEI